MGEWDEMSMYVETVDAPATHHPHHHTTNHSVHGAATAAAAAMQAAAAAVGVAGVGSVGGGHTATGAFLRAVLSVRHACYDVAQAHIERARGASDLLSFVLGWMCGACLYFGYGECCWHFESVAAVSDHPSLTHHPTHKTPPTPHNQQS